MGLRVPVLISAAAIVVGTLAIPLLALLFRAGIVLAPRALLAAGLVAAAYLVFRRRSRQQRDEATGPAARVISTGGTLIAMPDYPHELPWWDEEDGAA